MTHSKDIPLDPKALDWAGIDDAFHVGLTHYTNVSLPNSVAKPLHDWIESQRASLRPAADPKAEEDATLLHEAQVTLSAEVERLLSMTDDEVIAEVGPERLAEALGFRDRVLAWLPPRNLCEGCPPKNYPTDRTRCAPCPRSALQNTMSASKDITGLDSKALAKRLAIVAGVAKFKALFAGNDPAAMMKRAKEIRLFAACSMQEADAEASALEDRAKEIARERGDHVGDDGI